MNIKDALADKAIERADRWQTTHVPELPDTETLDEIAILGSYSFSLPETHRRLVRSVIEIKPGIGETPSAISRDYLRLIYKKGPRGTSKQLTNALALEPVPNVAHPGKFAHGFYVDIHACYWSIMQIIGWDVDYNPGMWISPGRPPYDYPFPEHKVGRNCLVSAGKMQGVPRYNPHKLPRDPYDEIFPGNSLMNPMLPRLIHDVLNCIGWQVMNEGAVYLNNDGMIAPTPGIAARCQQVILDWGLDYSIKAEGPGLVKASGTYQVGAYKTLNYDWMRGQRQIEIVYPLPYLKWLQKEFSFFAAHRKEHK